MSLGKKLGVQSAEDSIYALATCIVATYVFLIFGFTIFDVLGKHITYSSKIVIKALDAQFPWLLLLCIVVMYSSVFIWIFMGMASFFYKKKPNHITLHNAKLVSVLIPAHNEEAVVVNILQDILNQSYQISKLLSLLTIAVTIRSK